LRTSAVHSELNFTKSLEFRLSYNDISILSFIHPLFTRKLSAFTFNGIVAKAAQIIHDFIESLINKLTKKLQKKRLIA
jgi:hypothetical protein